MKTVLKISKILNIIAIFCILGLAYGLIFTGILQVIAALLFVIAVPREKLTYIYFIFVILFMAIWRGNIFGYQFLIPLFTLKKFKQNFQYLNENFKFMNTKITHIILTFFIALVWLINGLFVKVLNIVPRHQDIISQVLGSEHAHTFTITIGLLEILMAVWVISRFKIKTNAITQILIVLTMNTIEFTHAQELLMWGKLNFVFAVLFCVMVYYNAFLLSIKK